MNFRNFLRLSAYLQLLPVLESGEETLVGGQAVMEGVMMRAPHSYCIAVRKPDGTVVTEECAQPRLSEQYPIFKLPLLRGVGTLAQAMTLGVKALKFSANAALSEGDSQKKEDVSSFQMALSVMASLGFAFVMYKVVPLLLTEAIQRWFPAVHNQVLYNLVDGVLRIGIFLSFLFLISRWQEIRRIFEYHGAEHKVVFNFESGQPVTVPNAQKFVTWHPRCGTSFLLVVMVISMLVYMALPFQGWALKLLSRFVLFPVIAGLSYEVIRFAAKKPGSLMALLTAPGLWLQKITTQPPSDDQTDVAIQALNGAMKLEESQGGVLVIA